MEPSHTTPAFFFFKTGNSGIDLGDNKNNIAKKFVFEGHEGKRRCGHLSPHVGREERKSRPPPGTTRCRARRTRPPALRLDAILGRWCRPLVSTLPGCLEGLPERAHNSCSARMATGLPRSETPSGQGGLSPAHPRPRRKGGSAPPRGEGQDPERGVQREDKACSAGKSGRASWRRRPLWTGIRKMKWVRKWK